MADHRSEPHTVLALVTACGGERGEGRGSGEAASSSSSSAAPSSEAKELASTEELSAALLPAEAFGADANVVKLSIDEISKAAGGGLPPGATVQPESCAQLAGAAQLSPEDFGAIVAQTRLLAILVQAVGEPLLQEQVTSVVIDAVCRCGCSSVRLRTDSAAVPADRVSTLSSRDRPDYFAVEASGRDPDYQDVNVVLHVLGGRVGELEVFDAVKGEGAAVALDGLAGLTRSTVS